MDGFRFRYRLSGGRATIRDFEVRDMETPRRGDILNWDGGRVHVGRNGDNALVGVALETVDGEGGTTVIQAITDRDAVYAVEDPHARSKGDHLDLEGVLGAQSVSASASSQLTVVLDSHANEETLLRIAADSHHRLDDESAQLSGGELNAAIARTVVRYHNEHLGRGPTRARVFHRDNVIVVVLQEAMTKAERSLAATGRTAAVRQLREAFEDAMRADIVGAIEELSGCKVEAFMATSHFDPDMAAEIIVLDRPVPGEPA